MPLFIQGPPGSGKTYQGALFLKNLIENKVPKICFITAQSHKAIENVLNLFLKESPQHENNVLKFGGKKHLTYSRKPIQKSSSNYSNVKGKKFIFICWINSVCNNEVI